MQILVTVAAVFLILVANEWWWRKRTHGELSRKAVHIIVGSFVAFWPLYLSWFQIELLSLAFVVVTVMSMKLKLFKALHSVQRPTWGEVCFGAAVGIVAFITHSPAIYAMALLHMSLADGLAAIVGVRYGTSNAYMLFGNKKSLVGTLTFMLVSTAIFVSFIWQQQVDFQAGFVPLIVAATLLENVAIVGLDNLLVPVLIALAVKQLV